MLSTALVPPAPVLEQLQVLAARLSAIGITPVAPAELYVLLARFGNLTPDQVPGLAAALADGLAGTPMAVVGFEPPRLLESGDVVVALDGEVDDATALARAVPKIAERQRLYVDRRIFRPEIVIARVDPSGGRPLLAERVALAGSRWTSDLWLAEGVSLLRTRWVRGADVSEEARYIPIEPGSTDRAGQDART